MPAVSNHRALGRRTLPASLAIAVATVSILATILPVAAATGPYLVKDINKSGSSSPAALTVLGNILYFVADDGIHGRELWRSDGTGPGTQRVTDIGPGPADSMIYQLTAFNGRLYFTANERGDDTCGELWTSDGTADGTHKVLDPGTSLVVCPHGFTEYNGALYFNGWRSGSGTELWRTNGTAIGTQMVRDINPGSAGSNPRALVAFAGKLYFLRRDNANGEAVLYRTDGTSAGTKAMLSRKGTRIRGSFTWEGLWAIGDSLFIGRNSRELWVSKGTRATTRKLADVGTRTMVELNGTAYFAWYDSKTGSYPYSVLWTSDGTSVGTRELTFADGGRIGWASYGDGFLSSSGDKLAFFDDYEGMAVSDGTSAGTHLLDVAVWPAGFRMQLASLDGVFYFDGRVCCDVSAATLWRSDGTTAGTYAVSPAYTSGLLESITPVGDGLYFVTRAGKGVELYRYAP